MIRAIDQNQIIESPIRLLNQLVAMGLAGLFFSEILTYADIKDMSPLNVKHFAYINLVLAIGVLCFDKVNRVQNIKRPIFIWLVGFTLMNIVWGIIYIGLWDTYPDDGVEQFKANMTTILYIFAFSVLVYEPSSFRATRKVMVAILVFSVIINIIDFFMADVDEFSEIPGRAAGFYFNANLCGIVLCLGFMLTIDIIRPNLKLLYAFWIFLGVILTQSRGGIATFSFLLFITFLRRTYSFKSILPISLVGFIAIIGIGSYLQNSPKVQLTIAKNFKNISDRMEAVLPGSSDFKEKDSRIVVMNHYIEIVKQKPIFGNGLGAAYANEMRSGKKTIASHNQFLSMMTDFGIFGFFLIITFIGALVFYQGQFLFSWEAILFPLLFLLFCFTSHNLFDHPSLLFFYAMFGRSLLMKREHSYDNFIVRQIT